MVELADSVRSRLDAGEDEQLVRAYITAQGERLGLMGPKVLLPALTRKILRMPLREFLHKLADEFANVLASKRVGDAVNVFREQIGADAWFQDYILGWARTGEPGAMFGAVGGKVFTMNLGPAGETQPTVWAYATPFSDPRETAREFLDKCVETFPDTTWDRLGLNVEAARCIRLSAGGMTDRHIAELLLDEHEPGWRTLDGEAVRLRRRSEVSRVKKMQQRFWKDYLDSLGSQLSPDSD